MALDTDRFLTQVKLKAALPTGRYEDSEILDVAFDQLLSNLVPLILSIKEEYYVSSSSQNITQGTSNYPIPYRALGLALREVKRILNNQIIDISRINPEHITSTDQGDPTNFYLEAQDVVLYPTPSSTNGTLKLSFFLTPSKPVQVSECAKITNIDTNTGIITASAPSTWTTSNSFDFVSQRNGHKTISTDLTASQVSTTQLTFSTSDIPSTLEVNDYISLAGECPYFQIPDIAFPYIVQLVVNELLEGMGSLNELQAGVARSEILKNNLISVLNSRVVGAPKKTSITI